MSKVYTAEQKRDRVDAYYAGKSIAEICANGGPSQASLYNWIKQFKGITNLC